MSSSSPARTASCASAPGKVLLTGGYLVLERPLSGLVAAVDSRFYAAVQPLLAETAPAAFPLETPAPEEGDRTCGGDDSTAPLRVPIAIRSPQFRSVARYWLTFTPGEKAWCSSPPAWEAPAPRPLSRAVLAAAVPVATEESNSSSSSDGSHPAAVHSELGEGAADRANPFTEKALLWALVCGSATTPGRVFYPALARGLEIVVAGDNGFYGQRSQLAARELPDTRAGLAALPSFLPLVGGGTSVDSGLQKTGLGSSAALTTALVGAVLQHVGAVKLPAAGAAAAAGAASGSGTVDSAASTGDGQQSPVADVGRRFVHNVAQFSHCLAQGKIGSGFDVSSACFGSHRYTRFPPEQLDPLMNRVSTGSGASPDADQAGGWQESYSGSVEAKELAAALGPDARWANADELASFDLPRGFRLMMGDVDKGSNTPGMVSKVLKWWRADDRLLIGDLARCNNEVARLLGVLSALPEELGQAEYDGQLERWSKDPTTDRGPVAAALGEIGSVFQDVRRHLRDMGTGAAVEIEPAEQTRLIDRTLEVPGVAFAGVPGAGGYDAIFAIVRGSASGDASQAQLAVEQLWGELGVLPLALAEDRDGVVSADGTAILRLITQEPSKL